MKEMRTVTFGQSNLRKVQSRGYMSIKAIETIYKGYRFRSRQEARVAVYLDALEVPWQYELEGFEYEVYEGDTNSKGSMFYLPDFYLPSFDCYIEVKGTKPDFIEQQKIFAFVVKSGKPVICMVDSFNPNGITIGVSIIPGDKGIVVSPLVHFLYLSKGVVAIDNGCTKDFPAFVYEPRKIDGRNLYDYREASRYLTDQNSAIIMNPQDKTGCDIFNRSLKTLGKMIKAGEFAEVAARSARFEHGEKG